MRKCKQCREVELPPASKCTSIIEKKGYCSIKCLSEHTTAKRIAAQEKKARAQAKKDRAAVVDLNRSRFSWQHKQTQPVFNKMRVLEELLWFSSRGLEPVCISCGKPNMDWCCGHFKTVGAQPNLRYDELNTFLQCNRYCNMGKSGNIEGDKNTRGYKRGLLERFGSEEGGRIISYCETHNEAHNWACDELEDIRAKFSARVRELKAQSI